MAETLSAVSASTDDSLVTTDCSVVLLHLLSKYVPDVPVFFLDTGYHFPETHAFRQTLATTLGLSIRSLASPVPRIQQRDGVGADSDVRSDAVVVFWASGLGFGRRNRRSIDR